MKNRIQVGDMVSVLDDKIDGRVTRVQGNSVFLITRDGFEMEFQIHELIKTDHAALSYSVPPLPLYEEEKKGKKKTVISKKNKFLTTMEVDLHIEKLLDNTRGMDNYDILNHQIQTAQRQLEFAIRKKIQRLIFIHGVGEGVLRTELEFLLNKYEGISYQDADYQKYGNGATEVFISQKAVVP